MSAAPIDDLLKLARDTAAEAAALLRARLHQARTDVGTKSSPTDMVSEVDREAEALIVGRILAARPHDGILGEEGTERTGTSGVRWVIDPLDGTTNYLYRRPEFAVSIAAEFEGEVVVGVIHDAPRDASYHARRGGGAFVGDAPAHASSAQDLATALVGTGFGYDPARRAVQGRIFAVLVPHVRDVRRGGSACLDLCAVACGQLDAYYESGLQPWDMAAGRLIVEEAGGRTGFVPMPGGLPPALVAAPPALYEALVEMLLTITDRP